MSVRLAVLFTLVLQMMLPTAHAGILTSEIPSYPTLPTQSLFSSGVGRACTVLESTPSSLPCNPAYVALHPQKSFAAHVYMGNDYETATQIRKIVNGDVTSSYAQKLMSRPEPLRMESNLELTYRTSHFGVSVVPERDTYYSIARNKAYPVMAFHAMQERSIGLQYGGKVSPFEDGDSPEDTYLLLGAQARFVDRKFVHTEFSALDLATEDRNTLFEVKKQNAVYLEPGAVYVINNSWKPRSSLFISQTGWADKRYDEVPTAPELDLGSGIAPPVGWGNWELGLNYHFFTTQQNTWDNLRFGTDYEVKPFQAIFGIDNKNTSVGVITSIALAKIGVMYSHDRYPQLDGKYSYGDLYFTEVGIQF